MHMGERDKHSWLEDFMVNQWRGHRVILLGKESSSLVEQPPRHDQAPS